MHQQKKEISVLIEEAEYIEGLPFVKIEEVLFYKKTLKREKDINDVKLIEKFLESRLVTMPINLGMETYGQILDEFVGRVKNSLSEVLAMVVFGSVSRKQAKGESDVDIFVFYDNEIGSREGVNEKLNMIIYELRKSKEYLALETRGIYPEIYPFLISKKESSNLLWVFLDAILDGVIIFDRNNFAKKLIKNFRDRVESRGGRRVQLLNGGWCWVLFNDYSLAVKNLDF